MLYLHTKTHVDTMIKADKENIKSVKLLGLL